jgi:hypothetical protein
MTTGSLGESSLNAWKGGTRIEIRGLSYESSRACSGSGPHRGRCDADRGTAARAGSRSRPQGGRRRELDLTMWGSSHARNDMKASFVAGTSEPTSAPPTL